MKRKTIHERTKPKEIELDAIFTKTFLEWLKSDSVDRKDKGTFSTVINFVINKKIIEIKDLIALLGVNSATINRWRNGKNHPSSAFNRVHIIGAIDDYLNDKIDRCGGGMCGSDANREKLLTA